MHKHTLSIRNYRAIHHADIALNGITVLTGENGCGKSTIGRLLYYIVNGLEEYDSYVFSAFKREVIELLPPIDRISSDFGMTYDERIALLIDFDRIIDFPYTSEKAFETLYNHVVLLLDRFFAELSSLQAKTGNEKVLDRIIRSVDLPDSLGRDISIFIDRWRTALMEGYAKLEERFKSYMANRPGDVFFDGIRYRYKEKVSSKQIQLREDDIDLLSEEKVLQPYYLKQSIYVNSPLFIDYKGIDNIWGELRKKVLSVSDGVKVPEALLDEVKAIMGGSIKEEKDLGLLNLRYVSADGEIDIPIKDAATGLKTFAYLYRLIENGHITPETILVIDEPEVHLHPKWVVEFARILVHLHKQVGVKILLASHDPDMVAALQSIGEKEELGEKLNFYIAKRNEENKHQFDFISTGTDIEPIFDSFNIALDRIEEYGRTDDMDE